MERRLPAATVPTPPNYGLEAPAGPYLYTDPPGAYRYPSWKLPYACARRLEAAVPCLNPPPPPPPLRPLREARDVRRYQKIITKKLAKNNKIP